MAVRNESSSIDLVARLLAGYRPIEGAPDELMDREGNIRPVWRTLIEGIAAMSPEEIAARKARGDQYLRDAGVFFRQYGQGQTGERDWPLSHLPVLIDEDEWTAISKGLVQRAELLERITADLYGANRLVAEGYLPAPLVADNPEWLRPVVGVRPASGHYLHFVAFDIGRGPNGDWWVIGDRTQAPSGAGFALENRIATARVHSEYYGRSNIHRIAGFYRRFRDALLEMRGSTDSRIGILTPGPMNDTYFEHAYIARYLGFMLLEGEDLTIRKGQVLVRTVAGLKPISVLWRRLDAAWADPLELNESSRLGTPGLLSAIRAGDVSMVNALGSGVLETRAFLAFLPRICQVLLGEQLSIPNIATWWCGQPAEREYVKAHAESMTIGDAYATRLLFDLDDVSAVGGTFTRDVRETLSSWIDHGAGRLVGQEAVGLSTTPAFDGEVLAPRPMSLRVFLARTRDGWLAMPGGFARIGRSADSTELAMQYGGSAADVWIVGKKPVPTETMIGAPGTTPIRQHLGVLPSRAADNLFWLGRYVERAENTIRTLRAYHIRLAETSRPDTPLLEHVAEYLAMVEADPSALLAESVGRILSSAALAAGHVRDRLSTDGWLALSDLSDTARRMNLTVQPGDDMARAMGVLLRKTSGFSGLVHENMYRFSGWRFLSIGRSLERAGAMAAMLALFTDEDAPDGSLDLALEIADSNMSHRRRYAFVTTRETVVDLLALDPLNPRAIIHQLNEVAKHISFLPGSEIDQQLSPLQRAMLQTQTNLAVQTPQSLNTAALMRTGNDIAELANRLSAAHLR